MDYYVSIQFEGIKNNTGWYNWVFNNCKENADSLLIGAINRMTNDGK